MGPISTFDLVAMAIMLGWPGLVIGAVAGAYFWRRRRILGGVLGALAGMILWAILRLVI